MHSCYETAGVKDTDSAVRVFTEYFRTDIKIENDERFGIQPCFGGEGEKQ